MTHCAVAAEPHVVRAVPYYLQARSQESSLRRVVVWCAAPAAEVDPFTLTEDRAAEEARMLIEKGQLWLYELGSDGKQHIASIVASTRRSCQVAAITKVYTNPAWRKRGCAEALVREVTQTYVSH